MDFVKALVKLQQDCGVADLKMSDYGIKLEEMNQYAKKARETMGGLYNVESAPFSEHNGPTILKNSLGR
jgi:alcohol dehydrogenase